MGEKRILLIIGGGIAAFKAVDLVRLLAREGVGARVVLTAAGKQFVTPMTLSVLTGEKVYDDLFSLTDETEMGHIELSRSADLVVVCPATADLLAKAANGLANDLASTALLATDKPVLYAPAMNVRMWEHPAVQRNVERLKLDGAHFVGPEEGEMACKEWGPGRLAEPADIARAVLELVKAPLVTPAPGSQPLLPQSHMIAAAPLAGRRVIVTAGPTHEPIDPVRYIANRSSGKQGYALAEALAALGAEVVLVSGPTALKDPVGVRTVRVESACEMLEAVEAALPAAVYAGVAAVADWRSAEAAGSKIKKDETGAPPALHLIENPDILATIGKHPRQRPALVVGFAAETDRVELNARAKIAKKGADWIVANDVSGDVMGGDENQVILVTDASAETWPRMTKDAVARRLAQRIAEALKQAETKAG